MVRGLYTAAAGMYVQQQKVDVLANNMANADTVGFKRETTVVEEFAPYIWANLRILTEKRPLRTNEQVLGPAGTGALSMWTPIDFSEGAFQTTNSDTDLMITGQAFFALREGVPPGAVNENEIFYTRSGSFVVDQEGFLLTVDSTTGRRFHILDDQQNEINVNGWSGGVDYLGYFTGTPHRIGVVSFGDMIDETAGGDQSLIKVGMNRYTTNPYLAVEANWLTAAEMGNIAIVQGGLEASNVNTISEMVALISATRAYEASQKIVQMTDSSLGQANEIGRQ